MPAELSDLRVERISLLAAPKRPANRLRIAVAKVAAPDGGDMPNDTTTEVKLAATPELARVLQAAAATSDDEAGLEGELRGYSAAHRSAVLAMRRIFGRIKGDMAKDLLTKLPGLLGLELPAAPPPLPVDAGAQGGGGAEPAAIAASVDGIPLVPVVKSDGALDLSGVPKAKRAAAELLWKQSLELDAMKRRERLAVHVAKASQMPRIGAAQELGALLCKAADAMQPADFEALVKVLQQADAVVEKAGAFTEIGSGRPGAGADDPVVKVRQRAEKIAAEAGGKLNYADAMSRALAEQPDLYAEYVREQRRRAAAGA